MRRHIQPSECAQLVRRVRLHAGMPQKRLAELAGKKKAWLAKRELGFTYMSSGEATGLILAILSMYKAETVEKNRAKTAISHELDKDQNGQVVEKSAG